MDGWCEFVDGNMVYDLVLIWFDCIGLYMFIYGFIMCVYNLFYNSLVIL